MIRALDPKELIATVETLQKRISERFPGSGLSRVAGELLKIAQESAVRSHRIARPFVGLRIVIWLLVLGIVAVLVLGGLQIRKFGHLDELPEFVQSLEASLGSIFFIGAAIASLVTLETRWKRARALNAIHELRALAHIVDMHQLTKDPERTISGPSTPSSPHRSLTPFLLSRYLDYCSELLSLTGKIAALYVQELPDPAALEAVDQIENLTTGLSRGIWQKLNILDRVVQQVQSDSAVPKAESIVPESEAELENRLESLTPAVTPPPEQV